MLHLRSKLSSERTKLTASFEEAEQAAWPENQMKETIHINRKKSGAYKFNFLLALILLMASCNKEEYLAPEDQPLYFEYHFLNYAWGLSDYGWLVDRFGTIRSFEFPENYHLALHGEYLSLEQLEHNLGQADSVVGEVSASKLERKVQLIQGASGGELSKIHRQGADMGLGTYACYKFDPEQNAYQYILLSADGDYQQYNRSPEAGKLVDWLSGLLD